MTFLDDGPTAGASDATGRATGTTGSANGIVGYGAGRTGAAGAKVTANATADIVSTADTGAALPADVTGAAGAGHSHRRHKHRVRQRRLPQSHSQINSHGRHGQDDQLWKCLHHGHRKKIQQDRQDSGKHQPTCTQGQPVQRYPQD